jgi:hypothetical protein
MSLRQCIEDAEVLNGVLNSSDLTPTRERMDQAIALQFADRKLGKCLRELIRDTPGLKEIILREIGEEQILITQVLCSKCKGYIMYTEDPQALGMAHAVLTARIQGLEVVEEPVLRDYCSCDIRRGIEMKILELLDKLEGQR